MVLEDTLALVLLEEQIGVVNDESQPAPPGASGLEVPLELELQVKLDSSTTDDGVLGALFGVLEDTSNPSLST